jgi:hypothetical protein
MTAISKACESQICYCCYNDVDDLKRIRFDTLAGKILICSVECFKSYMEVRELEKVKRDRKAKDKVEKIS